MKHIKCAGVIFHDSSKIMLEDRRRISKHGEHWSFFGGVIQRGEPIVAALKREIKEELSFNLHDYTFFKSYTFNANEELKLTYYMFTAPIPDFPKLMVHNKSGVKSFTFKQALKLKMTDIDKKIIKDIQIFLTKY